MSNSLTSEQRDRVRRRLNFDENEPISAESTTPKDSTVVTENIPNSSKDIGKAENESRTLEHHNNPSQNDINIVDLSNMTQQQKYEQIKRWNFDFDNEVPLNGNWEWERVEPIRTIDHKEKVCALGKEEIYGDRNV